MHDVFLALAAEQALCLCVGQCAAGLEIVEGNDLGADKAAFKVGMDLTGGLRGLRALFDGPCAALVRACRQERDEAQQLVAALDQPVKAGLLQSQRFHEHGLLVRVVKLGNVGLKLCADGQNLAALLRGQFLHLREILAGLGLVHVVRCFDDANVTHVEGSTDPLRDIDIINTELIMADLEMIDRRIDKAQKNAKGGDKRFNHEVEVFTALRDYMNEGNLARTFECSEDDAAMIATSDLLTLRKTIYAANLSETDVNAPESCSYFTQVQALAAKEGSEVLPICAKLEADIAELDDPDEKAMFMEELGLKQSGLDRLIQCSYELLGLISFLTAGSDECRAWIKNIRKITI